MSSRVGTLPVLLLTVAVALAGCALQRRYEVKGRIAGFGDDGRTVLVEHEDIPGLMPAMTMPFKTRQAGALDGFEPQDAVGFTLVLTPDSSWIERLTHLPDSAVAAHPAGAEDAFYAETPATALLDRGDALPPVALVDQDGHPFRLADFEGRALLLTFVYTRCPLPDYCPLMSRHFQTLQPRLAERFGDRVHLLSISFDPEHDTPEVLRAYARRYTRDTTRWTFATGTPDQIAEIAGRFGVFYAADGAQFDHNLTTALVGPDGRVRRLWRGNRWTPQAVLEAVGEALDAS